MEIIPLHLHIYIIFLFGRGTVLVGKSKDLLKSFYTSKSCQNYVKVQEKLSRTMALKPAPHLILSHFRTLHTAKKMGIPNLAHPCHDTLRKGSSKERDYPQTTRPIIKIAFNV